MQNHISIFLDSMTYGGIQRVALTLCTGLNEQGYAVDIVLRQAEGALLSEIPAEVSVTDLGASRVARSAFPLRKYLETVQPDILYSMMTEINIMAVIAHEMTKVDTRLVLSEHNTPTVSAAGIKDQFVLRLAGILYPRADHIVTVSNGVRDNLQEIVNLPDQKLTTIYNPIDVSQIQKEAQEPLDHEWFVDTSTSVVMSAGRHAPQKGFDTLLRAFARLDDPNVRLVLLGKGEETTALQKLTTESGIESRVAFPGFVDNPFKYMANADTFVLSSWYEGFGNVLVEAMATGCPVVSTDCPSGPSEILEGGKYGPLVPPRDETALSAAIERTLAQPPDPEVLKKRATIFSPDTVITQYQSLFNTLL